MPVSTSLKNDNNFIPQQNSSGRSLSGLWNRAVKKSLLICIIFSLLLSLLVNWFYNPGFALLVFALCMLFFVAGICTYYFAGTQKIIKGTLPLTVSAGLGNSENNYRSLIERVSDAVVAFDKDWKYTYLNKKACEIFSRDAESLIGKNIWTEFPDAIDRPFYHAYHKALETQEYQYLAEYYPPLDKWFENHIYPSKDGITNFFKDVSEIKMVSLALQQNEEKYRSLIEQASDGIVITNMEGVMLEVNNSIADMIGFDKSELVGKHISKFLNEEEITTIPLRINELMQGKSLLYERRLFKKDGSYLPVEINSKMATTHTLIGFIRDITERKKNEAAIQKSTERFELIAEATNDIVWDHDFVTDVTWGNRKLYNLYGVIPGDKTINFDMFIDNIHPAEREGIRYRMNKAFENQTPSITEQFRFKAADGEYRIFYDRANIKYNKEGKPLRILGAMQDITDTEKFKKQLIKEKELSDSIINSLPGIFYLFNTEGKYLRWNKNLETITGYTSAEINNMHPINFFAEDEKELVTKKITNVFETGEDHVEADFVLKNGEKIPYYFTGRAINYEGQICLMGVGLDFSDKQKAEKAILESEEKYRTIVEQASDGIFIADKDTRFIDVNTSGCQMSGYTLEELKQMKIVDLIPVEDLDNIPMQITELKPGESVTNERRLKRKDGALINVEISAKVLPDGRFQSMARDITERKKVEEKLVEKEKKLQQVLANIADNFYVIDTDYNVVIINKVAERNLEIAWGKPVRIGTNLLDVIPGKGEEPIRENFERAFAGEGIEYEMHLSHPDLPTCVFIEVSPVIDESGRITGVSVIARDISERKKTEEIIKESEEQYRALVENAPEALVVFDTKKLMFVSVSESATRLFGMSKEDLLKIGPVDVSPKYQPDGRLSTDAAPVNIQKAINGEKPSFEWTHCKKSGELISCEVWLVRLPAENEVLIRGSIVDITERNEAKELLKKSYDDIRELASSLQTIREDERTIIAREIHDELGQQLTGLKMDLHWLSKKINSHDDAVIKKMNESKSLINATIDSVRKIATDLRPSILDDLGLLAALEWQGEEFEKRYGTSVTFINTAGEMTVKPEIATTIFRIYQELLTNITRHAQASEVKVELGIDKDRLNFNLQDNGIGFDTDGIKNKKTLGLLGIKERTLLLGGTSEFKSTLGKGSVTSISIPLGYKESSK